MRVHAQIAYSLHAHTHIACTSRSVHLGAPPMDGAGCPRTRTLHAQAAPCTSVPLQWTAPARSTLGRRQITTPTSVMVERWRRPKQCTPTLCFAAKCPPGPHPERSEEVARPGPFILVDAALHVDEMNFTKDSEVGVHTQRSAVGALGMRAHIGADALASRQWQTCTLLARSRGG